MSLSALLFDLDGTLIDSDPFHLEAFREIAASTGIAITKDYFHKHMSGRSNGEICAELWPALSEDERRSLADRKEAVFRRMLDRVPPINGLHALLKWARGLGLKSAVVSNAPRDNIVGSLAQLGVADHFSSVISGEELARGKPDPLPYLAALDALGVEAAEAVAFEDAVPGIRAATGAEIRTVGIATSLAEDRLLEAGACLSVRDYADDRLQQVLAESREGRD